MIREYIFKNTFPLFYTNYKHGLGTYLPENKKKMNSNDKIIHSVVNRILSSSSIV